MHEAVHRLVDEHRDEDLCLADLAGESIHHRHRLPGIIHKQSLAGPMVLAHDDVQLVLPGTVALTEPAVLETRRIGLLILLPQQKLGDTGAAQLGVYLMPVRHRPLLGRHFRRRRKQPLLQLGVAERFGQGPAQVGGFETLQVLADGGAADGGALCDPPGRQPARQMQA